MKHYLLKTLFITIALLVSVHSYTQNSSNIFSCISPVVNGTINENEETIPIIVRNITQEDERSIIPISAVYNQGIIELDFFYNMNTIEVVVHNNSTGEKWIEYIDTRLGYAYIDIFSYNPNGYYNIYFYSNKNATFFGEFIIR